ncbi:MAG: cupin domain-containing protein [Deltaproteobacteria bacterium]|nr:cupin domain-containing protein [Deltaproteobacteria bacterium]
MHVLPYKDVPENKVERDDVKDVTMRVAAGPDQGAPNFTMRVFTVRPGGHTPHHHHPYEHEIFFHAGRGEVEYEGEVRPVSAGHVAYVAPDAVHQIRNTGSEDLVFICVVPNGI